MISNHWNYKFEGASLWFGGRTLITLALSVCSSQSSFHKWHSMVTDSSYFYSIPRCVHQLTTSRKLRRLHVSGWFGKWCNLSELIDWLIYLFSFVSTKITIINKSVFEFKSCPGSFHIPRTIVSEEFLITFEFTLKILTTFCHNWIMIGRFIWFQTKQFQSC